MSLPTSPTSPTSPISPVDSISTAATSVAPTQGLLWVNASVMSKPNLSAELLEAWYEEHMQDVLNCPGNGRLFLRYKNLDPKAHDFFDPKFADRFSSSPSPHDTVGTHWPKLALVKLSDMSWMTSPQFDAMPRTSKLLPLEPDGSIGSAFSCWHAALRTYETVGSIADTNMGTSQAKYVVSIQTADAVDKVWDAMDKAYTAMPGFRSSVRYKNVDGLAEFQEPGKLPAGLVLYQFDGEQPPSVVENPDQLQADVWELTVQAGDLHLRL